MLLTRSPLEYPQVGLSARLACVKHAASVRPEPGSNSPTKLVENLSQQQTIVCHQRNPRTRQNRVTGSINWHWLNKHPVEFSNNQRTPQSFTVSSSAHPGRFVPLYCSTSALRCQVRLAVLCPVLQTHNYSSGNPVECRMVAAGRPLRLTSVTRVPRPHPCRL